MADTTVVPDAILSAHGLRSMGERPTVGKLREMADAFRAAADEADPDIIVKPVLTCWCFTCDDEYAKAMRAFDSNHWHLPGFILCPDCGNKRCPKAIHHDHACTRSNEPGQEGSRYA